jgi:hypothetical protein
MNAKVVMVIVGSGLVIGLGSYLIFQNPAWSGADVNTEVATTSQTIMNAINGAQPNEAAVIAKWYAPLTPFTIGRISMQASIADTDAERAQGLSDTPYIPIGIAKVFIFDTAEKWSFWMKDMNYPIDIFWLDENGYVVHVVENVAPETYPEMSFVPPVPAKYVIETKSGFAAENNIGVGAVANIAPFTRTQ